MNPIYTDRAGNPWTDRRQGYPPEGTPPGPPAWYGWVPPWYGTAQAAPAVQAPTTQRPDPSELAGGVKKLAYTVTEAAEALGVSRKLIYDLIHSGTFPSLKVGGRRLISAELLAEWVRRQAGGGGA